MLLLLTPPIEQSNKLRFRWKIRLPSLFKVIKAIFQRECPQTYTTMIFLEEWNPRKMVFMIYRKVQSD